MFSWFKNKKKINYDTQITLIKNIFQQLPAYKKILEQVNEGIIDGIKKMDQSFPNYCKFQLDVRLLNKYEIKNGRCFLLKDIFVYDTGINGYAEINFVIAYGVLLGYSMPGTVITQPNPNDIKVSSFCVQYFGEDDFKSIKFLFSAKELKLINPADVYEVELEGKSYYHLKDIGDGDFIGIDKSKSVFRITHDPYEIRKLDQSLEQILKENDSI